MAASVPLFFDIETIPNPVVVEHLDLPPVAEAPPETPAKDIQDDPYAVVDGTVAFVEQWLNKVIPDAEYIGRLMEAEINRPKGERKGIFDVITAFEKQRNNKVQEIEQRRKLLSTTPEYCMICAISWAEGEESPQSKVTGLDGDSEWNLLRNFWHFADNCNPLVGYNIRNFDLRVIMARSCILGVHPTRKIDMKTYSQDVCDLMQVRFGNGFPSAKEPGKLKTLCRLYGIDIPAGDVDGSQVEELWNTDKQALSKYVLSDTVIVRDLYLKWFGYFF